jgi:hypothetical protein
MERLYIYHRMCRSYAADPQPLSAQMKLLQSVQEIAAFVLLMPMMKNFLLQTRWQRAPANYF